MGAGRFRTSTDLDPENRPVSNGNLFAFRVFYPMEAESGHIIPVGSLGPLRCTGLIRGNGYESPIDSA
jgi:hypothetical protein